MGGPTLPFAYFIAMFCEAILHGMYTILAVWTLYLLLRKRREQRLEGTNLIMIGLTAFMYCLSTTHVAMALEVCLIAFFKEHSIEGGLTIFNDQGNPLIWGEICIELINCLIGDGIVCWRTYVLYGRNWRILVFPVICISGGTAAGIGMINALSRSEIGAQVFAGDITNWFVAFGVLTFLANLYSVGMITYKAWTNARLMKGLHVNVGSGSRYWGALLLIIESGAVYCVALVITIILFLLDNNGVYVIADMLSHLTGIYPTVIIVLVCLKITFHDDLERSGISTLNNSSKSGSVGTSRSRRDGANGVLTWRVASNTEHGADSIAGDGTGPAYKMTPIKIATKTEQVSWFDDADPDRKRGNVGEELDIQPGRGPTGKPRGFDNDDIV